ncbi:hypothetical protein MES5069_250227 [Mesorhizobium escarrei]|uniref:Uncharacterized protein n=1 Tax=Mesorhizobium escarrei TaxID=666018 RepID=A0ABN8JR20_9HYPH|nr:hypothetical protein MES5069_250227 [Mesorhizobium escarrei]
MAFAARSIYITVKYLDVKNLCIILPQDTMLAKSRKDNKVRYEISLGFSARPFGRHRRPARPDAAVR